MIVILFKPNCSHTILTHKKFHGFLLHLLDDLNFLFLPLSIGLLYELINPINDEQSEQVANKIEAFF
jgi:hypothetical protein